jgi:hypothetical protein
MSRPTALTAQPYQHPSAWRAVDLRDRSDWKLFLTQDQNRELKQALAQARARGAEIPALSQDDFPLPTLGPVLAALRLELMQGRGFCLIRGLDIAGLAASDSALIYWGIGRHLGEPMAQNAQGDVLGHITDLGVDFHADPNVRGYQTRLRLPFHNDLGDIVGLMCLQTAKRGGLSRLVSSAAIYNAVLERRPDLMDVMTGPWYLDRRGENPPHKKPYYIGAFFEHVGERLFCRYNRTYVETGQRFDEVPRLTARQIEALDFIDTLCYDPDLQLEMALEPGDMQFVNNYSVLHSRTTYEDWPEKERRRYLLRLWLNTGLVTEMPPSWMDHHSDWDTWKLDPRPPIFDLSMRRAELAH